jgi:UDP-N-acetylglucosamine:LPS N-acetylglucosamine transferase
MRVAKVKILAIASGGGHWIQLQRITPAFAGLETAYCSVDPSSAVDVRGHRFYAFPDASRRNPTAFSRVFLRFLQVLAIERPTIVITTGSAPCLIALALAKYCFRSKTIWIDSIANIEELSTSGKRARLFADVWLTQWDHLAKEEGPFFWGAVL